ncbi:fructose-6-phosphate aldolase [Bacillus sp. AFS006103]|nr:fructose-6-phosphate aldolase [Bacillus sp. AFS006103]
MLYLLDTANIEQIKRMMDLYPLTGVTTNPTIIAKEKRDFFAILNDIRSVIGPDKMLHVQLLSLNAEDMVEEARNLQQRVDGELYIKIPTIPEGIKAMKLLNKEEMKITATAIFTANQALMAAMAGAHFVAPYVNRIDNISGKGVEVVTQIVTLFKNYQLNTKVLAASFKNIQQVLDVGIAGSHSVTVNPEILNQIVAHPLTDASVSQFTKDWEGVYGAVPCLAERP